MAARISSMYSIRTRTLALSALRYRRIPVFYLSMRLSWLPIVVLATATPAWSSDHSLLLSHLNDAKRTAESLLSLIYNRFEVL